MLSIALWQMKVTMRNNLEWARKDEKPMAVNRPYGDGHRIGAVRRRSQVLNPVTGLYVKRDAETGRFMDVKMDGTPFKGVRKE